MKQIYSEYGQQATQDCHFWENGNKWGDWPGFSAWEHLPHPSIKRENSSRAHQSQNIKRQEVKKAEVAGIHRTDYQRMSTRNSLVKQ